MSDLSDFLSEYGITEEDLYPDPKPESTPPKSEETNWALMGRPSSVPDPKEATTPYPAWFNPAWLPEKKEVLLGNIPKLFSIPPRAAPVPSPVKPVPPPVSVKPVPQVKPINDAASAIEYLDKNKTPEVTEATQAFIEADLALHTETDDRNIADALGTAIGKLNALSELSPSIFGDDANAKSALAILISVIENGIKNLRPEVRSRVNKQYIEQVETTKPRPLQPLTSPWHGAKSRFLRNRTISVIKDQGLDQAQAGQVALDEWNRIVDYVSHSSFDLSPEDQITIQGMFAQQLLGGTPWDETERFIKDFINIKSSQIDMFQNVSVEDDDWQELAPLLKKRSLILSRLNSMPKEEAAELADKFVGFAKLSEGLGKVSESYVEGMRPSEEVIEKAQDIYNRIASLGQQILTTNPVYIQNAQAGIPDSPSKDRQRPWSLFEEAYAVFKNMSNIAQTLGIETLVETDASKIGLQAASLNITNPIHKRKPQAEGGTPRVRDPEKAREDIKRFYAEMALGENRPGFLGTKKEWWKKWYEKRPGETDEELQERINVVKEDKRIRDPDYKQNHKEILTWKYLASTGSELSDSQREIISKIKHAHAKRVLALFTRMAESWLPEEILSEIEKDLINRQKVDHSRALKELQRKPGSNQFILQELAKHIESLPEYFRVAKIQTKNSDIPKLVPGKTGMSILESANIFLKYALAV